MNYTKEQLEKLPKWAQSEIKRLQGLTQTLNQRLSEFNGESETNTYLVEGLDKKPLMNNAQIEFATGHNKMNKVSVYVRSNGMIDVNSDSRLGQELVILPRAANSFYLTFIER